MSSHPDFCYMNCALNFTRIHLTEEGGVDGKQLYVTVLYVAHCWKQEKYTNDVEFLPIFKLQMVLCGEPKLVIKKMVI